jgi:hypothetical protein
MVANGKHQVAILSDAEGTASAMNHSSL